MANFIKKFTLVNYDSRVSHTWLENTPYYDPRVVNYERRMFNKIDHWSLLQWSINASVKITEKRIFPHLPHLSRDRRLDPLHQLQQSKNAKICLFNTKFGLPRKRRIFFTSLGEPTMRRAWLENIANISRDSNFDKNPVLSLLPSLKSENFKSPPPRIKLSPRCTFTF